MTAPGLKEPIIMCEQGQLVPQIRQTLNRFGRKRGNLIPLLLAVQRKLGYLPPEAMLEIAKSLDVPEIDVYSVVTFYNQFRLNPPGRHSIRVCLGTACHMRGGHITFDKFKEQLGIDRAGTTPDGEFDLDTVNCVACCAIAPVTVVDDKPWARVDATKVQTMLHTFEPKGANKDSE